MWSPAILAALLAITSFPSSVLSEAQHPLVDTNAHTIVALPTYNDTFARLGENWNALTEEAKQAATRLNSALDHIGFIGHDRHLDEIPASIKQALTQINITAFEQWLVQTTEEGLEEALKQLQAVDFKSLPADTVKYIEEHPLETAVFAVETVVFFVPGGVYIPLLRVLGFGRLGVRARSVAALLQSMIGPYVPARGWFAHLVSAAMGGYGRAVLNTITRVTIKIGWLLGFLHR
ncbi:hypothetical protein BAUCODRAFT_372368 [Baudoinia panamericana UAMH 10762]|uniref:Uncharacterized protein n=1 Tax=Baudoinia panamericana (strain UAMH 10762) TaxID=717646 RepID=M2MTP6_BAUPA|nr:uncharacterized protein BAUCODRAFT_372368 [Baudoinia panamericana UAMH 10762]EMD00287.1 hypothetical protein BAUCODRAFT_372368 [Baudoinia panamericana UAMH 10762]